MKIIYLQDDGVIAVVSPVAGVINPDTEKEWTIEEIGKNVCRLVKNIK